MMLMTMRLCCRIAAAQHQAVAAAVRRGWWGAHPQMQSRSWRRMVSAAASASVVPEGQSAPGSVMVLSHQWQHAGLLSALRHGAGLFALVDELIDAQERSEALWGQILLGCVPFGAKSYHRIHRPEQRPMKEEPDSDTDPATGAGAAASRFGPFADASRSRIGFGGDVPRPEASSDERLQVAELVQARMEALGVPLNAVGADALLRMWLICGKRLQAREALHDLTVHRGLRLSRTLWHMAARLEHNRGDTAALRELIQTMYKAHVGYLRKREKGKSYNSAVEEDEMMVTKRVVGGWSGEAGDDADYVPASALRTYVFHCVERGERQEAKEMLEKFSAAQLAFPPRLMRSLNALEREDMQQQEEEEARLGRGGSAGARAGKGAVDVLAQEEEFLRLALFSPQRAITLCADMQASGWSPSPDCWRALATLRSPVQLQLLAAVVTPRSSASMEDKEEEVEEGRDLERIVCNIPVWALIETVITQYTANRHHRSEALLRLAAQHVPAFRSQLERRLKLTSQEHHRSAEPTSPHIREPNT